MSSIIQLRKNVLTQIRRIKEETNDKDTLDRIKEIKDVFNQFIRVGLDESEEFGLLTNINKQLNLLILDVIDEKNISQFSIIENKLNKMTEIFGNLIQDNDIINKLKILNTKYGKEKVEKENELVKHFINKRPKIIKSIMDYYVKLGEPTIHNDVEAEYFVRDWLSKYIDEKFNINMEKQTILDTERRDVYAKRKIFGNTNKSVLKPGGKFMTKQLKIKKGIYNYYNMLTPYYERGYEDISFYYGEDTEFADETMELLIDVKLSVGASDTGNLITYRRVIKFFDRPLFYIILKHINHKIVGVRIINIRELNFDKMRAQGNNQVLMDQIIANDRITLANKYKDLPSGRSHKTKALSGFINITYPKLLENITGKKLPDVIKSINEFVNE